MSQRPPAGERYRLEQLLGEGGMGAVYQVRDRLTDQRVALKLVPLQEATSAENENSAPLGRAQTHPLGLQALTANRDRPSGNATARTSALARTVLGDPSSRPVGGTAKVHISEGRRQPSTNPLWARMALAQEFRTLASLRHPHIISVLDYGFIGKRQPFFTMELLDDARSLIVAGKALPLPQQALLLVQLLRALSYLHRHGILHRDLKPANVMVLKSSDGLCVKLLDFGLALMRSQGKAEAGDLAGTISYMAPELFEGKEPTEAADLFAVGVIAYELFLRRHPFDRGDDAQLIGAILTSEPDFTPLQEHPALVMLLRRLLAKNPALRPSAEEALYALAAAVGVPLPQETTALRESTLQAARFVGREEPLALLRTALDAARMGAGEVRLLAGESGVGKSRLMEELRVYSLVQGVVSARGQAVSEGGGAYGIWRQILRMLCLDTELEELAASVLKSIVPDLEVLLDRTIPDAPAVDAQAAQLRLVNVIESLLLQQTAPLLLLLEDLHWADAESLALLRRLIPSCRTHAILIVASYRDDERPELPQALPSCPVLKLDRLSAANIKVLCQSMLGAQGCTPELVSFLEAETEGNVFFVIEVMRALAEEAGQLDQVASHRLPHSVLTGGIQAIVQRRLGRLPTEARPLLQLAAVAGRELDLGVLRCFESPLEPWLYLCTDAAVLEVCGPGWRFSHDKIRESLLCELDPQERAQLHLEWAHAIEKNYSDLALHAAALAGHYERGGDTKKASFYQVEAGVHALQQGASDQAAVLLQKALAARAALPKLQAARAYNGLIQALMALGRVVPCMTTYEEFVATVGFAMPDGLLSMASAGSAMLARQLCPATSRMHFSTEDRRVFTEVAQASRWACEAYVWSARPLKGIAVVLRGAELSHALGDKALQSFFLGAFGYFAGLVPLPEISARLLQRGSQLVDGLGNPRAELEFRRLASARHLNAADWSQVKSESDLVLALARRLGDENSLVFGLSMRTIVAFRQGDETAFARFGPELYERSRRNQSHQYSRVYPIYRGVAAMRRGDVKTAQSFLHEAAGYVEKSQDVLGRVLTGGLLTNGLFLQGRHAEALQRVKEILVLIESNRLAVETAGEGVAGVAEVCLGLWEIGSAKEKSLLVDPLRRSLAALRRCARVFAAVLPRAYLWHGRDAWNHGAVTLAKRLGTASLRHAERREMPYDIGLAQTWLTRFAATPPGKTVGLAGEARGFVELLARGLG